MTVFLEKLYVQTFVSRRGRKFAIRVEERKCFLKVSSNSVEIKFNSCKNNDPTRVCGRLFCARAAGPLRCRAGIYPPAFFSPGPADPIPPYDGGGPRRGNNNTTTTTRWRRARVLCHHRGQGTLVNPFGYPPLSDISETYPHVENRFQLKNIYM